MSGVQRTEVAIVGAGPAGLVLANVLRQAGIDALVIEQRSREEVETSARAGLVEHRVVEYLRRWGLADRLLADATWHGWCDVVVSGERIRLDYAARSGGDHHCVYPQQLLLRDLLAALDDADRVPRFDSPVLDVDLGSRAGVRLRCAGFEVDADYVVGCDGARGVVSRSFPGDPGDVRRRYPYDWLTMLAELTAPVGGIRYAVHERGFAGVMPRAGRLGRLYLEVPADDDLAHWPAARLREQLDVRLGDDVGIVEVHEPGILRMRSSITHTARHRRAFLAGDAAHVLTPSGAKGMNLAIADAADLAHSLVRLYRDDDATPLDGYAERRRAQARHALGFSEDLLHLLHLPPDATDPAAELRSRRAQAQRLGAETPEAARFARDYVGSGELHTPTSPLTRT